MTKPSQLPYLLRLFDDPSEAVRGPVLDALADFGEGLAQALMELPEPPGEELLAAVQHALDEHALQTGLEPESPPSQVVAVRAPPAAPRLRVGQLVRHKRYGYRGVVVARDRVCRAPDDWYQANRTRPRRNQPWYHVLVHDADHVTYAAQTSLIPDESAEPVTHPLLPLFFEELRDGAYVRNDRPWPSIGS